MNHKFQAAVHLRDDVTYVKLAGVIDEDNQLTDLTERIPAGTSVINLGEIERINSCGVRDWVNWLTRVEKNGAHVVLVECSPSIVAQINLVNNFTGGGVVKSFFAPYFCPNCDREKVLLVEASEMGPGPHRAPICRCDECDGVMDFDDMEDSYFAFLSTAKKVSDGPRIQAVVSEFHQSDAEKSKIRSRVGSLGQASLGQGGAAATSSLPSVPSLPPMDRSTPRPGAVPNPFLGGSLTGRQSFAGQAASLPGSFNAGGSDPGGRFAAAEAARFAGPYSQRSGSKMVYLLVAVLIAAICVLAVLLFSGGGKS